MKKLLLLLLVAANAIIINAQTCNIVIFSQDGSRFTVMVNGKAQNDFPDTRVKVSDLKYEASYKFTVNFENNASLPINKTFYIMENNMEYTYEIARNRKGELTLKPVGTEPISNKNTVETNVNTNTISQPVAPANTTVNKQATPSRDNGNKSVTTSTTTVTETPSTTENISMGVNIQDMGMSVNININDGTGGTNTTTKTTTTTTKTVSRTSTNTYDDNTTYKEPLSIQQPVQPATNGCDYAVSPADFSDGKKSIEKQSFADTKLKVAKTFTKNNCLSVNQIKEIVALFSFEETKLDYAKFAHEFCVDKKNYFKLSDSFSFSSSVDELNEFLDSK
jgi:predicted secreted protein